MENNPNRITFQYIKEKMPWPEGLNPGKLAEFLYAHMAPYQDSLEDTDRGIKDAVSRGGFIVLAYLENQLVGSSVVLPTGMKGYIPENLLLFVAVAGEYRNKGIGSRLIKQTISECKGRIKLHVEYDNPARALYERLGFKSKYADMRFSCE